MAKKSIKIKKKTQDGALLFNLFFYKAYLLNR
jgi:hypothetical protein